MTRDQASQYIGHCVDDTGKARWLKDMPRNARLVGWQCGFEPMFVAVWSYLPNTRLDDADAEELAADYLSEIGWFAEDPTPADYVL
jgi:hypothetical protein